MSTTSPKDAATDNSINVVERSLVSDEGNKSHARRLTDAEWADIMPPFYWMKVNFDQWSEIEYEVAVKWCLRNGSGWVYYSNNRFVFEKAEDYTLFKLWAANKPMQDSDSLEVL